MVEGRSRSPRRVPRGRRRRPPDRCAREARCGAPGRPPLGPPRPARRGRPRDHHPSRRSARRSRDSGRSVHSECSPTAFTPAPPTTATPQPRSLPARRTAKTSFAATICSATASGRSSRAVARSSPGRSRFARWNTPTSTEADTGDPRLAPCLRRQLGQLRGQTVEPGPLRVRPCAAHPGEHPAAGGGQHQVGLGVAAVRGDHVASHRRARHRSPGVDVTSRTSGAGPRSPPGCRRAGVR